ncbi:MAG: hypothetical protein GOVbin1230_10 [Prokaryotic dsDNA virus sp.]|nr:MAG: hypothetical protein GOVbin1230_10 [Prokaryotic dsDNA virus sp.]
MQNNKHNIEITALYNDSNRIVKVSESKKDRIIYIRIIKSVLNILYGVSDYLKSVRLSSLASLTLNILAFLLCFFLVISLVVALDVNHTFIRGPQW